MTVLMALSSIAVEQTKAIEQTMSHCRLLLDYLSGHSDAKILFHVSDMILKIHLDASYLSGKKPTAARLGIFSWVGCQGGCTHSFQRGFPC
jgi:hypothetical protein